ncbi:hypothetical protein [Azospirillum largimobile]
MVETTACPYCGSDYGHGPDDCPLCRSARRTDLVVRCVIGLLFLTPILALVVTALLDNNALATILSMD